MSVRKMILKGENADDISGPSWEQVREALLNIEPGHHSFIILNENDDFVQTLGRRDGLVVQWRTRDGLYVLGRRGLERKGIPFIPGSTGYLEPVWENEVMNITDAMVLFERFYKGQGIPEPYVLRDITDRNVVHEYAQLLRGNL